LSVIILEAALIAASISLDSFIAGFAYGANKIKISFWCVQIINIITAAMIGVSFLFGSIIKDYIPETVALIASFIILFLLGLAKLLDGVTKSLIKKHTDLSHEIKFSMFNFNFILKLYAVPESSDADLSKNISPAEAASMAIALSLDGLAVGLGAALGGVNWLAVILFSLATGMLAIISGRYIGEIAAHKFRFNLSWLGGVVLIALAFSKII
jgi:putative sporulation protein YtaF